MTRYSISVALAAIFISGCGKDTPPSTDAPKPPATQAANQTGTQAANQPGTPAEFAGVLFDALAKNDPELFKRYYQRDLTLLVPLMRTLLEADAKQNAQKAPAVTDAEISDELKDKQFPQTVDAFPALRAAGTAIGIDWSHVSNVKPEQWRQTDTVGSIALSDCRVTFESNGKKFMLDVGDVTKIGDKWFSNRLSVRKN